MSAAEQLKLLHDLQLIDQEIMEVERFRDSTPKMIEELEQEIEEHKSIYTKREDELARLKEQRLGKEKELEDHEARINKNKERLMSVKTNEEYHAIQKENEAQQGFIEELEDQVLRLMDDIEGAELALRKAKDRFNEIAEKKREEIDKLSEKLALVSGQLEEKNTARDEIIPKIQREFLQRYNRIRQMTGGVAVVRVVKRTCQGCLMNVSPQTYNLVIRNEEIITCPNCHRILYYEEESNGNNVQPVQEQPLG